MEEKDIRQASEDFGVTAKTVEELIDKPFMDFCNFMEGKNVGELLAFRSMLSHKIDELDVLGKQLIETTVTIFGKDERMKLGSVFMLVAKVQDRVGYIDYLYKKNSLE